MFKKGIYNQILNQNESFMLDSLCTGFHQEYNSPKNAVSE